MPLRLHVVHEADPRLMMRLDSLHVVLEHLQGQVSTVLNNQGAIMATIKQLIDDVAAVRGQADSVGALITQLRDQITGLTNGNLPADVQAQVDQAFADAEASKTELATAIAAPGTSSSATPTSPAGATAPSSGTPAATPTLSSATPSSGT